MSVSPRDAGLYVCHRQLETDQVIIVVLTTSQQPHRNGHYTTSFTAAPVHFNCTIRNVFRSFSR